MPSIRWSTQLKPTTLDLFVEWSDHRGQNRTDRTHFSDPHNRYDAPFLRNSRNIARSITSSPAAANAENRYFCPNAVEVGLVRRNRRIARHRGAGHETIGPSRFSATRFKRLAAARTNVFPF